MSTAAIPPVKAAHQGVDAAHQGDAANGGPGDALKQALVPSPQGMTAETAPPANPFAHRLPVELEVALPLRNFRVRNLLALSAGAIVESQWVHGEDVPLGAGDVQLAWSEFEVIDTQLAVRLTRLA